MSRMVERESDDCVEHCCVYANAKSGPVEDLYARFEGCSPELLSLLARVEEPVFRWALYNREPLDQWGIGTTT